MVQVELLIDHARAVPGQKVWIAAKFTIEKDWHLYWRNPGDSGLPPRIEFEGPEWLRIGEAHWPTPTRHELPGGILDFIHEGELVLLFPAEIAADAPLGAAATLHAQADWLVCRSECLFGAGAADAPLEVGTAPTRSPEADKFQRWWDATPGWLDAERDPPVQIGWDGNNLVIEAIDAGAIELFPFALLDTEPLPADIAGQGEAAAGRLTVAYDEPQIRGAPHIRGVVSVTQGRRTRSWEFDIPGPGSPERSE